MNPETMFNQRTSINLFYMLGQLFAVYTNINIKMNTAVREGSKTFNLAILLNMNFKFHVYIMSRKRIEVALHVGTQCEQPILRYEALTANLK